MAGPKRPPHNPRPEWSGYKRGPGLVLGFHGCDRSTAEKVLSGQEQHLNPSNNNYDWLGGGIYFWEADPWRAMQFAEDAQENKHLTKGRIRDPYVIGAIIDLGLCCNLLEFGALSELQKAHSFLDSAADAVGFPMPKNMGKELGMRHLDMAVIEAMHRLRETRELAPYDTVRAAFIEGKEIYPKAGFNGKNHIQIAVRTRNNIRGYFRLPGL